MQKTGTTNINWESKEILSQIADQINKPLAEIVRLIQYIQSKTENTDYETQRLSSIILESSGQIEQIIEDILRIEQNKKIEILVQDNFKYPGLYTFDVDKVNASNNLLRNLEQNTENRISKADMDWLIELETTVLDHIDSHSLTVSWLAGQLAVSERQIFRKIEQFTGLTPNKYIRSLKLHKAKELLENYTYSTVNEVAAAVGLKDPYYFSGLYEKAFGVRPRKYLG